MVMVPSGAMRTQAVTGAFGHRVGLRLGDETDAVDAEREAERHAA